ncbi:TNIP2 protein, partial [Atractosteus spatula]|nr:TNIP2 protein [Atractosteus spatula]
MSALSGCAELPIAGYNQADSLMESIKRENAALKTKLQSYNTLNTFYHETNQEIAKLSHQMCLKDNIIADLKARLAAYENTTVHMGGEEPLVFGPSKSLFENLCQEIGKLKHQQRETERSADRQLGNMKLEIQELQQQLSAKEQEIQRITSRPQHEKDLEILQLQQTVAEKDRVQATRAVLCYSLAEEAENLRAQLGATVGVCQQLLQRLERMQQREDSASSATQSQQPREGADSSNSAQLQALICRLQEENKSLKQQVAYVENLNAKWQKYDSSREEFVKGLCQKLKQLTPQSANASMMQQEIVRLNRLLEEKMKEAAKTEENRKRDREQIQMLEQQVLIYADDFKSERADRERAQSKIQDLQEEIVNLQLQLRRQARI